MQGFLRQERERARLGEANFVLMTLHNGILAKSNPFAEGTKRLLRVTKGY